MNTARYAIFSGPGQLLKPAEMPLPTCGPGEALVRISLATICGSDLHTIDGRRPEPCPSVLGHEGVGHVVAVGDGRNPMLIGKRVTWTIADSCGTCAPCREWDLPQKCTQLFKYGHAEITNGTGLNGCYATLVPEGIRHLRVGGYYAFIGMVHPNTPLELSGQTIVRNCLTLRGFHNYAPRHLELAVKFLTEHRTSYPWEKLVSPPFQLNGFNAALDEARTRKWLRVSIRP